jgi:hypothetical protein
MLTDRWTLARRDAVPEYVPVSGSFEVVTVPLSGGRLPWVGAEAEHDGYIHVFRVEE